MVTTIPWGDGSGDNIYLTYSASEGDQTILVSSDANNYTERTKDIIFTSGVGSITRVLTVTQDAGSNYVSITFNDTCITFDDVAIAYPEGYIIFADPVVEQICATNWGDGVGLTPSQAAQVTSLNGLFDSNTDIVSFDELQYFTGISNGYFSRISNSFSAALNLEYITFPETTVRIGDRLFNETNAAIKNLKRITFLNTNNTIQFGQFTVYSSTSFPNFNAVVIKNLDNWLHNTYHASQYSNPTVTAQHLYVDDTEVTSVTFPQGDTEIKSCCLAGLSSITSVTVPSSVTSIGAFAFYGCSGLTGTLTLPSSLTSIGGYAFNDCSGLTGTITIPSTCTSIDRNAFDYCTGITEIDLPSGVSIGGSAFSNASAISEITFRGIFTETNAYCFRYCTLINTLNISSLSDYLASTITSYGSPTYATNSNVHVYIISTGVELTSITIPSGTTTIEGERFRRWAYITSVTIPSTVTSISNAAFAYCSGITGDFTVPTTVTSIGTGAFQGWSGITNLTVPAIWSNAIYNGCGNGTGTFTLNGDLTLSGSFRQNTLQFENIIFNGDVDISAIGNNIFVSDTSELHCVKSIRFLGDLVGNYGSSGVYHTYSGTKSLEFIEVLGSMTNVKLPYGTSSEFVSGAIIHLGYNGVVATPTQVMGSNASRISTIYVDSQSVIDAYAADTDWAQYSSKFDLWSNYNGPYKN